MTETIKLTMDDICRHEPKCDCKEWVYVTLPNYRTYHKAFHWLREERKYKLISAEGIYDKEKGRHSGAFRFKFLCKHEGVLFALRWAS